MNQDTICAIATAQGGAIGCIRVSGPDAIEITSRIFTPARKGKKLKDAKPYTLTFGHIHEEENIIDEVLVSLFRAPHSYTGEDSTEIMCHGSSYILQKVLQLLIGNGCRLAAPGEYTQRAFLGGKMDLSQAEAVADLIASTSAATHRLAMSQMRGGFSKELASLRDQLLHFTSLIELELDFSDHEELEFADRSELCLLADGIEQVISRLVQSFSVGNAIKNGVPVAIIGETNDTIENLGIERTFQKLEQAEIVLWIVDATNAVSRIPQLTTQILPRCEGKRLILVFNKTDLVQDASTIPNSSFTVAATNVQCISISAKGRTNLDKLQQMLISAANLPTVTQNDVIVTNIRHYEALTHALEAIHRVQQGLAENLSGDFVSQDIRIDFPSKRYCRGSYERYGTWEYFRTFLHREIGSDY